MDGAKLQFSDTHNVEQLLAIAGLLAEQNQLPITTGNVLEPMKSPSTDAVQPKKTIKRKRKSPIKKMQDKPVSGGWEGNKIKRPKEEKPTLKTPQDKVFRCEICPNKSFAKRKYLRGHIRVIHEGNKRNYKCSYCPEIFKQYIKKCVHEQSCQTVKVRKPRATYNDDESGGIIGHPGGIVGHCTYCGKGFRSKPALVDHMESIHEGKTVTCPICNATVKWKKNLKFHMWTVHKVGNEPIKKDLKKTCDKCDATFTSHEKLQNHLKQVHDQRNVYECRFCSETFSNIASQYMHMMSHGEYVKHQCSVCKVRYAKLNHFEQHIRTTKHRQMNDQPLDFDTLTCYECNERFPDYAEFEHHLKTYANTVGCVNQCKLCQKKFPHPLALRKHRSVHITTSCGVQRNGSTGRMRSSSWKGERLPDGKQKCKVCGKVMSKMTCMKYHMKWHRGEHDYKCEVCGYASSFPSQIRLHRKRHFGATLFRCRFCDLPYNTKRMCTEHEFSHKELHKPKCDGCGKEFTSTWSHQHHLKKCPQLLERLALELMEARLKQDAINEEKLKTKDNCDKDTTIKQKRKEEDKSGERLNKESDTGLGQTKITYYKCKDCGKDYRYKRWAIACENGHKQLPCYKCSVCGEEFFVDWPFVSHLTNCDKRKVAEESSEKHEEDEFIIDYYSEQREKIDEGNVPNRKRYKCSVCSKAFRHPHWWYDCEQMHKGLMSRCSGCGQASGSEQTFARHLKCCKKWRQSEDSSVKSAELNFLKKMNQVVSENRMQMCTRCGFFVLECVCDGSSAKTRWEELLNKTFVAEAQETATEKWKCSGCCQVCGSDWTLSGHIVRCKKWMSADMSPEEEKYLLKIFKREDDTQLRICSHCGHTCTSYQTFVKHFVVCRKWKVTEDNTSEDERIALGILRKLTGVDRDEPEANNAPPKAIGESSSKRTPKAKDKSSLKSTPKTMDESSSKSSKNKTKLSKDAAKEQGRTELYYNFNERRYTCRFCLKEYRMHANCQGCVDFHVRNNKMKKESERHNCSGCGELFISDWALVRHLYGCEKWKRADPNIAKNEEEFLMELYTKDTRNGKEMVVVEDTVDWSGTDDAEESSEVSSESDGDPDHSVKAEGDQNIDVTDVVKCIANYRGYSKCKVNGRDEASRIGKKKVKTSEEKEDLLTDVIDLNDIVFTDLEQDDKREHGNEEEEDELSQKIKQYLRDFGHNERSDGVSQNQKKRKRRRKSEMISCCSLERSDARPDGSSGKFTLEQNGEGETGKSIMKLINSGDPDDIVEVNFSVKISLQEDGKEEEGNLSDECEQNDQGQKDFGKNPQTGFFDQIMFV